MDFGDLKLYFPKLHSREKLHSLLPPAPFLLFLSVKSNKISKI